MSNQTEHFDSVSRDDVIWCYRNLLGREPESVSAVDWHSRNNSFRSLVAQFVQSAEFRAIMDSGKGWLKNKAAPPPGDGELQTFAHSIDSNIRVLRDRYRVASLEVEPVDSSPLHLRNDHGVPFSVHLPSDNVIGLFAVLNGHWDISKARFVERVVAGVDDEVLLVDVGANVGLFSRQCLSVTSKIAALYAYEPHSANFSLLCRNFAGIQKARLNNFGLGKMSAIVDLYLDPENCGNYSLNVNAMPQSFQRTPVNIVSASDEEGKWLAHDIPIFYKSDTQGSDELIATSLSSEFWERVCGGIFELWRIPGKEYDPNRFVEILDRFENKAFDKNPQSNVSSSEIMNYLSSADHQFDDLLFWRG